MKLNEHAECVRACDKALELDAQNEKCLFRRGQSHLAMSNHEESMKDFQEVLKINPGNGAAKQSMQTCRDQVKAYQQKEKQLYTNIFAKMAKSSEKASASQETNGESKPTEENNNGETAAAAATADS